MRRSLRRPPCARRRRRRTRHPESTPRRRLRPSRRDRRARRRRLRRRSAARTRGRCRGRRRSRSPRGSASGRSMPSRHPQRRLMLRAAPCGFAPLRGCAARHGPRRIGAPLAPGARIEPRAGEARVRHREQVVTRGDARPAVVDDVVAARGRRGARRTPCASAAADLNRPSASRLSEIGPIERAGNVSGHRIERLDVAAIALAGAGIEQQRTKASRDWLPTMARRVDGRGGGARGERGRGDVPACRS